MFVFILVGWVFSLTLHEFAHAYMAWKGGDWSVVDRGYLMLDPRLYIHSVLSFAIPLVFIAMGGIGLPGGAVLINRAVLSESDATKVALAGPFVNLAFTFISLLPVTFFASSLPGFMPYALAFFGFLQLTVFILNMLPIPGLDGYAAIEPTLPPNVQQSLRPVAAYGFFILFIALFYIEPIQLGFFNAVYRLFEFFNISDITAAIGQVAFEFWNQDADWMEVLERLGLT